MEDAQYRLKQRIEEITDEQIEEIEAYIEEEVAISEVASEVGMLLFSYIRGKSTIFGNIVKDI